MSSPPELIIVYNPQSIDVRVIKDFVSEAFCDGPGVEFQFMPTENGTYYLQKNYGASLAKRDLVMFIDSDVVPEPGWLAALIESFRDPKIAVAGGNTYIDPGNLYSKAFALFWFFPLRSSGGGLTPSGWFFANNVIFRRKLFLSYRFPDLPLVRGQCTALGEALQRDGHQIYIQNEARVSHPPPNGLIHYVRRALCEGHDNAFRARATGGRPFPLGALARFKHALAHSVRRIWRERDEVELGRLSALSAIAIAAGYHTICLVGEAVFHFSPEFILKRVAV